MDMEFNVLICNSRKDTEIAKRICKAFDEVGIICYKVY